MEDGKINFEKLEKTIKEGKIVVSGSANIAVTAKVEIPAQIEIISPEIQVRIVGPTLDEVVKKLKSKEGRKFWEIIIYANMLELVAKYFLVHYFKKRGIASDKWLDRVNRFSLGVIVSWLRDLDLISDTTYKKLDEAVKIRNDYVHDLLKLATFSAEPTEREIRLFKDYIDLLSREWYQSLYLE